MNTNDIIVIRKVCETGSIAKAANHLYMTPQAISVVIKRVENELGILLFRRTAGGMIMNDYGKIFYNKSGDLIREISELEQMFHLDLNNTHGVIRVAFTQGVIVMLGVDYIMSFCRKYSNFHLEIIEGPSKKIEDLVRTEKVDIGISTAPLFAPDEFQSIPWCRFKCCTVFNCDTDTGRKLSGEESVSLSSLKGIPVVLQNKDFSIYAEFKRLCLVDYDFEPSIFFETVEIANALAIAAGGTAIAIVPRPVAENSQYLQSGHVNVKAITLKDELYWDWCFLKKKNHEISKIEQAFMDHLTSRTVEMGWV